MVDKAEYMELVDAWWKTASAMGANPNNAPLPEAKAWHASVFARVLEQCGWTVDEWNSAVAIDKDSR